MDLFNALKRSHSPYIPLRQSSTILFQLYFDEEKQACLKVIDKKGKDCEVDYRSYQGEQRAVLKALHKINDNNSMVIDWENDSEHLYLAENDFLVYHLKNCNNLVDSQLNPIFFTDEKAIVGLSIKQIENSPNLKSQVFIECQGQTIENGKIITESYLLADKVIYEVLPLGDNYNALSLLETEIDKIDLEKYFSLIYSSFDNLSIRYLDFQEKENLPLNTNPTLIFEKIDEDQSLYIRVTLSASNMEASFLTNYDITHVVNINELEHTLLVSELSGPDYDPQANIRQLLNKHKRKLKAKGNNDYFEDNDLFILEEEIAQAFIYQDLPDLIQTYEVLGAEKLKSYKIRAIKPKLNLSLGHGIDFLEGDAQLDMAGEKLNLFDAIGQYRKQSYITLSDGTHALVNPAYMKKLERLFKKKKDNVAVSFFDLPLVEELIDDKVADKTFKKTRKIFEGFNTLHKKRSKLPPVKAKLRDYQKQGYHWLSYLQKHQLGGCLADDMGLGKTLQAITLLASLYPKESLPTLVVMPKSLIFNWTQEINKFAPQLEAVTHYGSQRDFNIAKKSQIILTTYGMVRNDIELLQKQKFCYIILDESQQIKNINAQASKAVMLLNAKHRLALSGTPVENNLGELYSLFRFLNPAMFGSVDDFNRNYALPIQQGEETKEAAQELKTKIYPFILRRLKRDVLKDLPDKIEQILYVDMNDRQAKFYNERRQFYHDTIQAQVAEKGIKQSQFYILQALTELRQIASIPEAVTDGRIISPKRELLMEYLQDSFANQHKVLIFANYLSAIEHIGSDLAKEEIDYLSMTGATRDRQQLVTRFQNDVNCRAFVMTLKTGGLGLNLTAADTIFIFDPWWNKSAENQAIDRAHRMGQDKTVFSYKIITKGTIEEKMIELQEKKSALFDSLISSDSASIKSLDEDDIEFMLGKGN